MEVALRYGDDRENEFIVCDSLEVLEGRVLCAYVHLESAPAKVGPKRIPIQYVTPPYTAERIDR